MRASSVFALALTCPMIGCKPNLESQVPGTWTGARDVSITFKSDKTYTGQAMGLTETGTWAIDKGDLVVTPLTFAGKPIEEVKKLMAARLSGQSAAAKNLVDDIDKPMITTLSADGKTMTTDKSRDTNSGPGVTLTKQGG